MDNKTEIGKRIRECREQAGITMEELGGRIGLNKSTVQRYESGKVERIKLPVLQAIARELNADPLYLTLKADKREDDLIPSNIANIVTDEIRMIPVFENVSAGFGAYADSEVMDYVPLFVRNPSEVPNLMGIRVRGDSMYPKIEDGDIIIVRKQTSVDSGSIAVILLDGEEGLVKKVEYGDDWIDLISINPEYKPRRFEGEEVTRLQVVVLVKQVIKML